MAKTKPVRIPVARIEHKYMCLECGQALGRLANRKSLKNETYECCNEHCTERGKLFIVPYHYATGTVF